MQHVGGVAHTFCTGGHESLAPGGGRSTAAGGCSPHQIAALDRGGGPGRAARLAVLRRIQLGKTEDFLGGAKCCLSQKTGLR